MTLDQFKALVRKRINVTMFRKWKSLIPVRLIVSLDWFGEISRKYDL